jgi:predicted Zn-dependent protease with MMP-like domain
VDADTRKYFDDHLERVIDGLPEEVGALFDDVPLIVEDYPSTQTLRELRILDRRELCGLHTGIPLTERLSDGSQSGIPSETVTLFREGILALATNKHGRVDEVELKRQIRITILHEYGHHFGMTEEDLEELGYD